MLNSIFLSTVFEQKINIIGGVFLGLSIYVYFYEKYKVKKELIALRNDSVLFENLIRLVMSDNERYTIKEMVGSLADDLKSFKSEVRDDIKEVHGVISRYMIANNDRISLLEGKQKVTAKTIAIYLTFISTFVMIAINTYMTLKG